MNIKYGYSLIMYYQNQNRKKQKINEVHYDGGIYSFIYLFIYTWLQYPVCFFSLKLCCLLFRRILNQNKNTSQKLDIQCWSSQIFLDIQNQRKINIFNILQRGFLNFYFWDVILIYSLLRGKCKKKSWRQLNTTK